MNKIKRKTVGGFSGQSPEGWDRYSGKYTSPRFDVPQPDDVLYDPAFPVPVSRQGKDRGAVRRDCETVRMAAPDGGMRDMLRVRSGLARMLREGTITSGMFEAGCDFKLAFDRCGFGRVKTADYSGAGRGGQGPEDRMASMQGARDAVHRYMTLLGGTASVAGKALWWIVGHEMPISELPAYRPAHGLAGAGKKDYWRGVLVVALQIIEADYVARASPKRRARTVAFLNAAEREGG